VLALPRINAVLILGAVLLMGGQSQADIVHCVSKVALGSTTNELSDITGNTTTVYETPIAPNYDGYIFVEWATSANQRFVSRDSLGRSYESVRARDFPAQQRWI